MGIKSETNNSKLQVMLLQLPHPATIDRNLPLAPGYLKAWAQRCGLLTEVEIEILAPQLGNRSGCQLLIDVIAQKSPDILGLSLYLWNSERTCFILRNVKKRLPQLKIVVGGPEVAVKSALINQTTEVDFWVFGEGEETFVDLLRHFLRGKPALTEIAGLAIRQDLQLSINRARPAMASLDQLPSPYLLGYIDPKEYREMMMFTMRGCLQGCSYCSWSARGRLRSFNLAQLEEEVRLAYRLGKELTVSIADSAFNTSPVFEGFCEAVQRINRDKRLRFNCFLQAEKIDPYTVIQLQKCHVVSAEVGLQSVSAEVLGLVSRPLNLERFMAGVNMLQDGNIPLIFDTILGLPGDSLTGFSKTMTFLTDRDLNPMIFNLSVGYGSKLFDKKEHFAIEVQDEAPFYVRNSGSFPAAEMQEALRRYRIFSADMALVHDIRYPTIASSSSGRLNEPVALAILADAGCANPITHLVLRPGSLADPAELADFIGGQTASQFSLLFAGKGQILGQDLALLEIFLSRISRRNPYITWDILLENSGPELSQECLDRILTYLENPKVFLDFRDELFPADLNQVRRRAVNIFALQPWTMDGALTRVKEANCIRTYRFTGEKAQETELASLSRYYGSALLVDFDESIKLDQTREIMARLQANNHGQRGIFYKNWVRQRIWEQDFLKVTPEQQCRRELLIDSDGTVSEVSCSEAELYWEAVMAYQLLRPEHAGIDLETFIIEKVSAKILAGEQAEHDVREGLQHGA